MLSVISKPEYWGWRDAGVSASGRGVLKDIQDTFILYHLKDMVDGRICEVGGGDSRVLPKLAARNECWNVDRFEGQGGGPSAARKQPNVRIVRGFVGEFSSELPDEYFDVVFSISVVEHIPAPSYGAAIQDCVRILKPGGVMLHAIDVYLPDAGEEANDRQELRRRVALYLSTCELGDGRLTWLRPPEIDVNVAASARHACNQVDELYLWNKTVPQLRERRETGASCSLQMILERST